MYTKSEAFYDAIYGTMKDYEKEAQQIHAVIQQYKQSQGNALLDVACGTGAHIAFLQRDYTVEGLDLDGQMLAIATRRNPGIIFHHADMVDFDLGYTFDVVMCLFSSIGLLTVAENL
jgi:dTDP-3-amino-3,4,6-trideoxy-alpha-D-glucopyranose N,N-dimethyltransferase